MAKTKLKGNVINTAGSLPAIGTPAREFVLTGANLQDRRLSEYRGRKVILNIFPSIDTAVCATSVRRFNQSAAELDNSAVLCISRDLPFALSRFCGAEGITNVETLSELRTRDFGGDYGLEIVDGVLAGLLARAVIVIDPDGIVRYTELVPEIGMEPDYQQALNAVYQM